MFASGKQGVCNTYPGVDIFILHVFNIYVNVCLETINQYYSLFHTGAILKMKPDVSQEIRMALIL